jgi:hypothetical protein
MEENNEQMKRNNFIEEIEDLYRLHYITKNHDHMIELRKGKWRLFEPSKFIYAYFAFNSFYNFEWSESLVKKELIAFPEKITLEGIEKNATEGHKYKSMIDFIFSHATDSDKDEFFNIICGQKKNEKIIQSISQITLDNRIKESERDNFKKEFEKLITERDIKVGKLKKDIVRFVYLVRNNIFHGTKNTIKMSENCQRERLEIYTNILVALNQLLFNILERKTDFQPQQTYHIYSRF